MYAIDLYPLAAGTTRMKIMQCLITSLHYGMLSATGLPFGNVIALLAAKHQCKDYLYSASVLVARGR
jgi:hypothetical protein